LVPISTRENAVNSEPKQSDVERHACRPRDDAGSREKNAADGYHQKGKVGPWRKFFEELVDVSKHVTAQR
ncbi:hypothetical protein, partial [Burkholderia cenocepacia]|uniref:hypothetical protein n=1 Tax=Burkholderia cenocepacia TaxID=95486 RepID=UPI001F17681F